MVVVGIKALSNNVDYHLVMTGPDPFYLEPVIMSSNIPQTISLPANQTRETTPYFAVYKWYNWQHKDFRVSVDVSAGEVYANLGSIGEASYQDNGISGIPLD